MITIFHVSIKEIGIVLASECMLTFIFPEHTKNNNYFLFRAIELVIGSKRLGGIQTSLFLSDF